MSLPAHTSAVGYHEQYEPKYAMKEGRSDFDYDENYDHYNYVHYAKNVRVATSHKPTATQGDKVTPYRYFRHINKVVEDAPMVERTTLYSGGGKVVYDETFETYHSVWREPFNWYPWDHNRMRNACDESEVKALNNLAEAKAQLGADLAQARQTVDMFSSNASQLAGALLAAKRGRWGEVPYRLGLRGRAARSGRTAANRWLELQYGWLPLMGSIHDLQGVLHQAMESEKIVHGRGTGKYETESEWKYERRDFHQKSEGSAKTHLMATVDSPFWHNLDSAGLINPLSVAWELVPWSFAIDWFVPVGATLEAITATAGLSFKRGYQSVHHKYRIDIKGDIQGFPYEDNQGYSHGIVQPGAYTEQRFEFDRYPFGGFPRPKVFADLTPFSTPRALNALALVRQLFR